MWCRNLRLAVAAVALAVIAPRLEAQVNTIPPGIAALQAYEIPERLLTACPELSLSVEQIRALKELAADLRLEDARHRVGSKPWLTAARVTSPQRAYTRALGLVDAKERSRSAAQFAALVPRCR